MYEFGYNYEKLAVNYLKDKFSIDDRMIEHRGSLNVFQNEFDVYIRANEHVFSIEVKGTQIIDETTPQFNRVKLTKKDIDESPDLFLIIIDVAQLGDCDSRYVFKLIWANELLEIINRKYTRNKSVSLIQIFQLRQANPFVDEF